MVMKNIYRDSEHAFAGYIRILGKGKTSSRSLSYAEAHAAMGMILRGEVLDVQLGAFLMLLRVKEESPEELAGFVAAAREHMQAPRNIAVDLDWSSYAGKRKHYPWFLFAVKLLAAQGIRVFMHGASGHTLNRLYTENLLPQLGMTVCQNWNDVAASLQAHNFAYLALENFSPALGAMIGLRNVMGLRSPVHTLARLLNPLDAPHVMQAIFHPAYRQSHQQAAALLGYRNSCVIKGEGGEIERNPDGSCLAKRIVDGVLQDEEWPMIFNNRHSAEEAFVLDDFLAVWRGDKQHEYGEMAVMATLALALRTLQHTASQEDAMATAKTWWDARARAAL